MLKNFIIIHSLIIVFILSGCSPILIRAEHGKPAIVGETNGKNCIVEYEKRLWFAFYGLVQVNHLENNQYFKDKHSNYQISEVWEWQDYVSSILGGFLLGISSRQIQFQKCDTEYTLLNPLDRKLIDMTAIANYSTKYNKSLIISLRNDDKKTGIIRNYGRDEWFLSTYDERMITDGKVRDLLIMKDGTTYFGKIIEQGSETFRFETESGEELNLDKSDISRVKMHTKEHFMAKVYTTIPIKIDSIKDVQFAEYSYKETILFNENP